jgi:SAM-dependent methyltransferase
MAIKADWTTYLHNLRRREMNMIFNRCPMKIFNKTLELGAGDGFVSEILADFTKELVCTDLNAARLAKTNHNNIIFRICDAEKIDEYFGPKEFDMIFSSSLLEHLPDWQRAMSGIHKILKDDGIGIHFMPNRVWKIATILLYIPNKIAVTIDKIASGRLFKRRQGHKWFKPYKETFGGNNLKTGRKKQFFLSKLFLPKMHGVSNNTIEEFVAFGKKQWVARFESTGFTVLAVRKVVFNSGYGFGFERARLLMERLGLHTLNAYIVHKKEGTAKYAEFFT